MDILFNDLKDNLSNYSYKVINDKVKTIVISIDNLEILKAIIDILKLDKRKNVAALSVRIEKNMDKYIAELERVKSMYEFDRAMCEGGLLAGVDEVGRGPLAGPIVAAAVILDLSNMDDIILEINDSKLLSEEKRERLALEIKKRAISYQIAEKSNLEIDNRGISYCNNQIFIDSINGLTKKPYMVLSDGYLVKNFNGLNKAVIKGDRKSASIACASIIAKVYRDNLMKEYDKKFEGYDFSNNVGYGTKKHTDALKEKGAVEIHRMSFLKNLL